MTQELRQKLSSMVGPAEWHWLKPHIARDAVVFVNPGLDLLEVGIALTNDNVQAVQRWIGEQLLTKPTAAQLQNWGSEGPSQPLRSLIVQPYVLVQMLNQNATASESPDLNQ